MTLERPFHTTAGLLAFTLYACGGHDAKPDAAADAAADTTAGQDAAADTTTAPASARAADPGQVPLTVADIDRWEKGIAAELAAVHGAAGKFKEAKTANDTIGAIMGLQETATLEAGAKAAGVAGALQPDPEQLLGGGGLPGANDRRGGYH